MSNFFGGEINSMGLPDLFFPIVLAEISEPISGLLQIGASFLSALVGGAIAAIASIRVLREQHNFEHIKELRDFSRGLMNICMEVEGRHRTICEFLLRRPLDIDTPQHVSGRLMMVPEPRNTITLINGAIHEELASKVGIQLLNRLTSLEKRAIDLLEIHKIVNRELSEMSLAMESFSDYRWDGDGLVASVTLKGKMGLSHIGRMLRLDALCYELFLILEELYDECCDVSESLEEHFKGRKLKLLVADYKSMRTKKSSVIADEVAVRDELILRNQRILDELRPIMNKQTD